MHCLALSISRWIRIASFCVSFNTLSNAWLRSPEASLCLSLPLDKDFSGSTVLACSAFKVKLDTRAALLTATSATVDIVLASAAQVRFCLTIRHSMPKARTTKEATKLKRKQESLHQRFVICTNELVMTFVVAAGRVVEARKTSRRMASMQLGLDDDTGGL